MKTRRSPLTGLIPSHTPVPLTPTGREDTITRTSPLGWYVVEVPYVPEISG